MRLFGYLLVGAGTIGGVLSAAPTPELGAGFTASVLVLAAGLLLLRIPSAGEAAGAEAVPSRTASDLERALAALRRLSAVAATAPFTEVRDAIDAVTTGPLLAVAATIARPRAGSPTTAAFAASFAIAERRLNRCWSAAVDGARAEMLRTLPGAVAALEEALGLLLQDGRAAKT